MIQICHILGILSAHQTTSRCASRESTEEARLAPGIKLRIENTWNSQSQQISRKIGVSRVCPGLLATALERSERQRSETPSRNFVSKFKFELRKNPPAPVGGEAWSSAKHSQHKFTVAFVWEGATFLSRMQVLPVLPNILKKRHSGQKQRPPRGACFSWK